MSAELSTREIIWTWVGAIVAAVVMLAAIWFLFLL